MQGGSKYIFPGAKEPIEVQLFDQFGQPLAGKTDIYVRIRRHQDDLYYDWSDDTFKAPGSVVQMNEVLQEISATYSPGIYRLNTVTHVRGWDTSLITNGGNTDVYEITIVQVGGTDAVGLPVGYELHVDPAGNIAAAIWDAAQSDHTIAGSFGDLLRRVAALQKENYFIDQMTYNPQGLMLTGRIRLFVTKAAALAATDGGVGEGEFATYSFDTTETVGSPERARTARSVRDA